MGCGASAPATAGDSAQKRAKAGDAGGKAGGAPAKREPEHPDRGLSGTHDLVKFLGKGGTGDTYLFRDRATGEEVAIKLVKRPVPKILQPNLLREIRIQADLGEGHVNIIEAKEALLTDGHLALVMEFAACGSLTSYVADKWPEAQHTGLFCSEDEARYFFRQFISAVEYCHEHFVAHRDLKLDNTLLDKAQLGEHYPPMIKLCDFGFAKGWTAENAHMKTHLGDLKLDNTLLSDDQPPRIKLCDFGFSRHMDPDTLMYTHIGTPVYMAPELIHSRTNEAGYDGKQVDVWASGILLIVMLLGTFPYDHIANPDPNTSAAQEEVWEQQTRQPWDGMPHIADAVQKARCHPAALQRSSAQIARVGLPERPLEAKHLPLESSPRVPGAALSPECRDLLDRIFRTNEAERITVAQIKEHAWFTAPLTGAYAEAAAEIARLQAAKDEYTASRKISGGMLKRRNEELQRMLDAASTRPAADAAPTTTPRMRVDLREQLILDNPAAFGGRGSAGGAGSVELGGISEDAEGELRAQQSNLRQIMNGGR